MSTATYPTAKRASTGKAETLRRKAIRADKYKTLKITTAKKG